jgi:diguanylate cyclase (GGDEF)-like protein/PAS domain S-box-containing protein
VRQWLSNDYYRFIFEHSYDAILLTSPDGRIHRANPATCRMFQMTEDELCEVGRAGIVDETDPRLLQLLKEREETGSAQGEIIYVRKNGKKFTGSVTATIFKDAEGNRWSAMIIRDMSELQQAMDDLKRANEKAMRLASYDYLTHIFNRRVFVERLRQEIERSRRENTPTGLLLLDINHFKSINDGYGHLAGDMVLKKFAAALKKALRPYDVLGRFGGDEFIIYLPNTDLENSAIIAERIRKQIAEMEIKHKGSFIGITTSVGVTECIPHSESCLSVDALIARADKALYLAKKKKDCVVIV